MGVSESKVICYNPKIGGKTETASLEGTRQLQAVYDDCKLVNSHKIARDVLYAKQSMVEFRDVPGKQLAWVLSDLPGNQSLLPLKDLTGFPTKDVLTKLEIFVIFFFKDYML